MNIVIFDGRIGEMKIHETQAGTLLTMSVCHNDNWKNKDGNWEQRANWIKVIKWKPTDFQKGLQKGDEIMVRGKLNESEYKHDGKKSKYLQVIADELKFIPKAMKAEGQMNQQMANFDDPANFDPAFRGRAEAEQDGLPF